MKSLPCLHLNPVDQEAHRLGAPTSWSDLAHLEDVDRRSAGSCTYSNVIGDRRRTRVKVALNRLCLLATALLVGSTDHVGCSLCLCNLLAELADVLANHCEIVDADRVSVR